MRNREPVSVGVNVPIETTVVDFSLDRKELTVRVRRDVVDGALYQPQLSDIPDDYLIALEVWLGLKERQ